MAGSTLPKDARASRSPEAPSSEGAERSSRPVAAPAPKAVPLALSAITKHYPGVKALTGVDFDVRAGEVHALAGENGAGKSTLMKVMAGVVRPDAGTLLLDGRPTVFDGPGAALAAGIRLIHQELNLVPFLSVAENIFLGNEPRRGGFVRSAQMRERAREILVGLGAGIDPTARVERLSVGQQQVVEIAKALAGRARVIAMDEPTSALTDREIVRLFELVETLKRRGVGLVYISHRLEELSRLADRVTVLRDGCLVATRPMSETPIPELIRLMVGRPAGETYPARTSALGRPVLRVENLSRGDAVRGVSFEVRAGEVLGVAGLMGSGRTELLRALFGADPADGGRLFLDGQPLRIGGPDVAIRHGIAFAPEDRKHQGLLLGMSVRENITLAALRSLAAGGFLREGQERTAAAAWVKDLGVKTPSPEQRVRNLSGGNQQKVVLAKWLFCRPKVLLLDEPTRGIDVGAKAEIYELVNRLAADGLAIVMVSSELPEVMGMSDRIAVMCEGRLAGIVERSAATQERLMHLATGQA